MQTTLSLCDNLSVGQNGRLLFAGQDTVALAERYGTPLYLMDEDRIRANARRYRRAAAAAFGPRGRVLYASKAASFKQIYRILREEGLGADVVSLGEILTADAAGFPLSEACFHSNNKTDDDIRLALTRGVGCFAVDSREELDALDRLSEKAGVKPSVLLRLTPGIDPHTFEAVRTGQIDSKFGFPIATGQAAEAVRAALGKTHLRLLGFHCHVGSQIFDLSVFRRTAEVMLTFLSEAERTLGYRAEVLDLGGGIGVPYTEADQAPDIEAGLAGLGAFVTDKSRELGIAPPAIWLEPGRSLVADAGLTLYTVGSVKTIPGFRTYVSVDGGMTDNPRYALYRSHYTVLAAGKADKPADRLVTLVGRCCESGDILQPDVPLPSDIKRGDVVAVCTTGAYCYAMASHYNRIPNPPVVMLKNGGSYIAVKREAPEDLLRLDQ